MMAKPQRDELVFLPLGGVGEIGMNLAPLRLRAAPTTATWLAVDFGVAFAGAGPARRRPHLARHRAIIEEERAEPRRHRHHPRPRGPFRRAARPLAAAARAGLRDALHRRPARGQARQRAGRADDPDHDRRAGEPLHRRPVRRSSTSTSPTRSPSRMRSRSARRSASSSTPATGRSTTTPALGPPTDEARFRAIGDEGVLALICNSTNAMREGAQPERDRGRRASSREIIAEAPGRVAVTTFASNVGRIRSIALAARAGRPRGGGRRPRHAARHRRRRRARHLDGLPPFLDEEAYRPPAARQGRRRCCTGSQGEPRAALARVAEDDHPERRARRPATLVVFSSRTIPGNEKAINAIINRLIARGVQRHHRPRPRWSTSPAIRAATSCARCTAGSSRRSPCRCMARRCIWPPMPSSPRDIRRRRRC